MTDYFGRSTPVTELDRSRRPRAAAPERPFVSFLWPLGDVVTALARAGLRIELVVEQPAAGLYGAGAAAARWPGTYLIRAVRS